MRNVKPKYDKRGFKKIIRTESFLFSGDSLYAVYVNDYLFVQKKYNSERSILLFEELQKLNVKYCFNGITYMDYYAVNNNNEVFVIKYNNGEVNSYPIMLYYLNNKEIFKFYQAVDPR